MAAVAIASTWLMQNDELATVERDCIGRARSAMSAVDAHLRGTILGLQTLAASKNLEAGNIAAFHAESQRVLRGQPSWVNIGLVNAATREQLFDAVYALGKPEPFTQDDDSFDAVLKGARVSFGNVLPGPVVRNPTARVRVGVYEGEVLRYVLAAPLNLKLLTEVLESQRLPDGWSIVLLDRRQHVICALPAVPTGSPAEEDLQNAIQRSPQGWWRGKTGEGAPTYTAHVTSELSGWHLAISMPARAAAGSGRYGLGPVLIAAALAFLAGLALTWLLARRPAEKT